MYTKYEKCCTHSQHTFTDFRIAHLQFCAVVNLFLFVHVCEGVNALPDGLFLAPVFTVIGSEVEFRRPGLGDARVIHWALFPSIYVPLHSRSRASLALPMSPSGQRRPSFILKSRIVSVLMEEKR